MLIHALAGLSHLVSAQKVIGEAEGFAAGVTGGGESSPVYPEDITQLETYLTDSTPRVIVLDKIFDFTDLEGTESGTACASWGTGSACQKIIQDDCGESPAVQGTWNKAPRTPIDVASDKTILGEGSAGGIKGKGLRFRGGATNIIVQNIAVTDLNPEYVWGGDAIGFDGCDLIWVDHVTVLLLPFLRPCHSCYRRKRGQDKSLTNYLYRPHDPAVSTTCSVTKPASESHCPIITSTENPPTRPAAATAITTGPSRWSAETTRSP